MAGTIPNVILQKGVYYVRVAIPANVRHLFSNHREFWRSLQTGNFHDARKASPPIVAEFKGLIFNARRSLSGSVEGQARAALTAWAGREERRLRTVEPMTNANGHTIVEAPDPDWQTLERIAALKNASDSPDGWLEIKGFDQALAGILSRSGFKVGAGDPMLVGIRQEAAIYFQIAAQHAEKQRHALALRQTDLESVGVARASRMETQPLAIKLSALLDEWIPILKPNEKEEQRVRHMFRRLIEHIGDKPINHVTKVEVQDFFRWLARFPSKRRGGTLQNLQFGPTIEKFESLNAALVMNGEEPMATIRKVTAEEWFRNFKRAFRYAVEFEKLDRSPFDLNMQHVVVGGESIARRGFSDEELNHIFSAPLFTGFDPENSTRFREIAGATVIKDTYYWLPIFSLYEGGRLTEFAASPLADIKKTEKGTWYLDLSERPLAPKPGQELERVKNKTSQRVVPFHPKLIELGFIDYVADLKNREAKWLFPELRQGSKLGAGHSFSRWWGDWMNRHNMPDPTLTHHSWRHTWKRQARESRVKKEIHDVLSGHTGETVADGYGRGARIEILAAEMAKIDFPSIPLG